MAEKTVEIRGMTCGHCEGRLLLTPKALGEYHYRKKFLDIGLFG